MTKLYRTSKDRIFGGVCGGIGKYFNIDPIIIRFSLVLLTLFGWGIGIMLYLIAWIIIPEI